MNGSCHCGRVTVRVPGSPDYLNACNCTLCFKKGALWGYFPRSEVEIEGATEAYVRGDEADPYLSTNFCPHCGTTTHWMPLADDAPDRMGVNMRLFEPGDMRGIEVRYGDWRNSSGELRPYYRAPTIFDGIGAEP